jgi:uracil-DNA glycosylase family 4
MKFEELKAKVESCRLCPRLVLHRETVPAKKQFEGCSYWRRPVCGFGDLDAKIMLLGLAPSGDGANRTGRIFTGDPTAKFLMRALFEMGFANQPTSVSRDDGLMLTGVYVTPLVKCFPPKHMPLREEIATCNQYLKEEFHLLKNLTTIIALGSIAFKALVPKTPFKHGVIIEGNPRIIGCYHPSPQNTNTGVLTMDMMKEILTIAKH